MIVGILILFVLVGLPLIGLFAADRQKKTRNTVPPPGSSHVPDDIYETARSEGLGSLDQVLPGFTSLTFRSTTVWVFRDGLVTKDTRTAQPARVYRWSDCSLQYSRIISTGSAGRGLIESFTLRRSDETKLAVRQQNNDTQTTALLKVLIDRTTSALLPVAWRSFYDGAELDFGLVRCSRSHLGIRGTTVPWAEVEKVDVRQGTVFISRRGKLMAASVPASNVTDLHVFLDLAKRAPRT